MSDIKLHDRTAIVEVACLEDFDDLDAEDRAEDGSCAVDGSYALHMKGIPESVTKSAFTEGVLDHFHASVPISCLEHFSILVRLAGRNDDPGSMRDLGAFNFGEPAVTRGDASAEAASVLPEPTPYGTSDPFDPLADD